ncbi:MAG: carbamoyltransferase [Gemmatimonadota bacterium]
MHVLGISCHYHDAAAALLRDGELVAAAQEERFSRRKHDASFPRRAVDFCLRRAGIEAGALDYAVFYEKPLRKFDRILRTTLATYPRSWRPFGEAMISWFDEKLWIKSRIREELGLDADRVLFAEHHVSHAASAFFCSPFREAALLTVDGVGEWTTAALGRGRADWGEGGGSEIELLREARFPHSLGLLYSTFTAWLGFRVNNGEYKVMGMASYGEPRHMDRLREVVRIQHDGSFRLDLDYFDFHRSPDRMYSDAFLRLFGPPRAPESDFVAEGMDPDAPVAASTLEGNQHYADVAATVQRFTEEAVLRSARHLHERTDLDHLCVAGGVALNSVANGRLMREGPFEHLYVQPAAGDAGGAVGAALYAWHVMLGEPRSYVMDHVFLGDEHSTGEVRHLLEDEGVSHERPGRDELTERVVDALCEGKVVALHQGRFEWGPRALGNRSILADPRRTETKDVVNRKVKFREPFRPFAPALPADAAPRWFEGMEEAPDAEPPGPAPTDFMLAVMRWRDGAGARVPAVNHQGTGRLQTVRRRHAPRFHAIVSRFGERTGVPVLLNTSFNLRGEPIVSTPATSLRTFRRSGIDLLVLEDTLVEAP